MTTDAGSPGSRGDANRGMALLAGVALLVLPAATLLCATAGFAVGHPVPALALAGGSVAAVAVVLGAPARVNGARRVAVLAACAAFVLAASCLAPLRYDTSWDGQTYHQQAVIALAGGWNPLAAPLDGSAFTSAGYVNNMAKGAWVAEASVYRVTGHIETAKVLHLVLGAAALLCAMAALLALPGLGRWAALGCAAVATVNPVALTQAFTFYIDGGIASAITAFVACAYLAVERRDRLAALGLAAATVHLVNAKLTGLPYAVSLWALTGVVALARGGAGRALPLGAAGALALLVAVLGPGWNPYATNTIRHGHPFYPVAGQHAQDIVRTSRPEAFAAMNRFERLTRATFSSSSNFIQYGARLKLPFAVVDDEREQCGKCDVRMGGFGPQFSGALILSVLALSFARRGGAVRATLFAAGLLATVLVTAEGWWARFAPQLWLVPIVLALAPLASPGRRGARLAGALVLATMAADVALVALSDMEREVPVQHQLRRQLRELAALPGPVDAHFDSFEAAEVRLSEAGVRWRAVTALPCSRPTRLWGSHGAELCLPSGDAARSR